MTPALYHGWPTGGSTGPDFRSRSLGMGGAISSGCGRFRGCGGGSGGGWSLGPGSRVQAGVVTQVFLGG